MAIPTIPQIPGIPPAPSGIYGVPSVPGNTLPYPPGVAKLLPPRTLTSLIPPVVRNLARYAEGEQTLLAPALRSVGISPFPSASYRAAPPPISFQQQKVMRGFLSDFSNTASGDTMYFQYNPMEVRVAPEVGWIISQMPGRSHPFIQYGGGGPRRISFTLQLYYTTNQQSGQGNVADCVNWLQSYTLPQMAAGNPAYAVAPKQLLLCLGRTLATEAYDVVRVIVTKAEVEYSKLFRPSDLTPLKAEVRMEFVMLLPPGKTLMTGDDQKTNFGAADRVAASSSNAIPLPGNP